MKLIKKILIVFIIFVVSGCSVKYNLNINQDGSINETVIASENTKKMESLTRQKGDNAVNYLFKMFNRGDSSISISSITDNYNTASTAVKVHDSIDDYVSNFKSDLFNNIKLEKKDDTITLVANQDKLLGNNSSYSLLYDEVQINIKVPYTVTYNNADTVSGNTYTWNINKNTGLKEIKISYIQGNKKNNINVKINNKIYNISYAIVVVSIALLIILFLILFVYRKNRKNNRM